MRRTCGGLARHANVAGNANDPTTRHLVPEDQQTALACDAQVRARHGLSLAFFAKHPAEPYRSRVGFSKLQIGSPIRSFFCWSTNTRLD